MIECRSLSKQFGGRKAVDDLSFDVRPGVVTGFLGPNGAGKSTTLRLMLDLDRGTGRTTFDGYRFQDLKDPIRQVGAVLEARDFHPGRTARNHLRMLAAGGGLDGSRVAEVLQLVGLGSVADRRPGGFSLGMGQRLGLATACSGIRARSSWTSPATASTRKGCAGCGICSRALPPRAGRCWFPATS